MDALDAAHSFAAAIYIPWILAPTLAVLVVLTVYSRRHYPDVFHRIVAGAAAGALATIFLDAVRLTGVVHGWLPGDMVAVWGKLVMGPLERFEVFYPVGVLTHYLFGASFGLFYTFVWGRRTSCWSAVAWGVVWALIIELGMMTLPPVAPSFGLFGVRFAWPQLFLLSFTAHVLYGIALGAFAQQFLGEGERGGLLHFLRIGAGAAVSPRSKVAA